MHDERPILFVGDIQGCAAELEALLETAAFRPGAHRLLPVGDTVNRGPEAPGVLRLLERAGAEPILGNHERALLAVAERDGPPDWLRKGSAHAQLVEAGAWERAVDWMRAWPLWRRGPGWIMVHAGLHPRLPLEETDPDFLTNVRYCDDAGRRPPFRDGKLTEAPEGYRPWFEYYRGEDCVVFGHWARRGLLVEGSLRGLDTGCVYGGHLTGLWWPADRVVQVNSRQPYRRLPVKARYADG